jgi:hypothetical protein
MTRVFGAILLCVAILIGHAATAPAQSQSARSKASSQSASKTPSPDDKAKKDDPPATFPGKLVDAVNSAAGDKSDYIPCFFTRQQLLDLRPEPASAVLSTAQAEVLRASVIKEALDPSNANAFEKGKAQEFAEQIGESVLEGLTQSQATSKILKLLGEATQTQIAGIKDNTKLAEVVVDTYGEGITPQNRQSRVDTAKQAADSAVDTPAKVAAISKALDGSLNTATVKNLTDKLSGTGDAAASKNNVAQATIQAISAVGRPLDIGCSMSILSYETTRKAFGETMADEYIGVQIVVRNVNPDREFLVQSAEFKVDDDINGRLGRYYSGVDKMTAREYMLASRELGKRNLMISVAQGVGTILSATVPFTGPFVKQFSGVYNGGFTSALTTIFPDHNTEQLKLIDDEGFSNSRTDRTVVPKSGTAEFVIFVSSREFEEGWWTDDCAERIAIQNAPPKMSAKDQARCIGTFNLGSPNGKCVTPEIGIDINAARRVCLAEHKDASIVLPEDDNPGLAYFKPKSVGYRHWSPQALALFRELSLTVVAGTHVSEESDNTPALTKIDCPVDEKGDVKLESAKDGSIACTLTGTNLDKVAQLKLRNSQDATDTTTADGSVGTSGDSKSAKASFAVDDLGALAGSAYKVYTVTSAGTEAGGAQLLHFDPSTPVLSAGPTPTEVDLGSLQAKDAAKVSIKFKGYHLDKLGAIRLSKSSTDTTSLSVSDIDLSVGPSPAANAVTVSLGPDDIKGKIPASDFTEKKLELSISLLPSSAPNSPIATIQKLFGTGVIKGAASIALKPSKAGKVQSKPAN